MTDTLNKEAVIDTIETYLWRARTYQQEAHDDNIQGLDCYWNGWIVACETIIDALDKLGKE